MNYILKLRIELKIMQEKAFKNNLNQYFNVADLTLYY